MSAQGYYNENSDSRPPYQQYNSGNSNEYPPRPQQQQYGYPNQQQGGLGQYGGGYQGDNTSQQPYYGQGQQQGYNQQNYNQQGYGGYGAPQQSQPYGSPAGQPYPHPSPPAYGAGNNNQYSQPQQGQYHPQGTTPGCTSNENLQWGYGDGKPLAQTEGREPVDPNNPQEGERGFLGAVAGGAAGAYGGHKVGHGFLGTIGGAIAGSKLEDFAKEKKKEKKEKEDEEKKRKQQEQQMRNHPPPQQQQHQQQQPHGEAVMKGNFSGSASNIRIERQDLVASLMDRHGHAHTNGIDLNKYLSNEWGHFKWVDDGGNFWDSARGVRLADNGRVLEAELADGHGGWNRDYVKLDERIGNDDGRMVYLS